MIWGKGKLQPIRSGKIPQTKHPQAMNMIKNTETLQEEGKTLREKLQTHGKICAFQNKRNNRKLHGETQKLLTAAEKTT